MPAEPSFLPKLTVASSGEACRNTGGMGEGASDGFPALLRWEAAAAVLIPKFQLTCFLTLKPGVAVAPHG